MAPSIPQPYADGVARLLQALCQPRAKLLLYGPPGAGKSYLAAGLARRLWRRGQACACLSADPGSPAFGVPAALNLGTWQQARWQLQTFAPLCSLDAARFRLPLVEAVNRLMKQAPALPLIIDAPGLTRGVAAAELLPALVDAAGATLLAVLGQPEQDSELEQELASLSLPLLHLHAAAAARRPPRQAREAYRTALWDRYLAQAREIALPLDGLIRLGTPPPADCPERWRGLLVALGDAHDWPVMGEVLDLQQGRLQLRCPALQQPVSRILVRDARRLPGQPLATVAPRPPAHRREPSRPGPALAYPPDMKPLTGSLQIRRGDITAELVNGLFEDPLLLVKTHWSRRCLLFDLGHTTRLPLHYANQVSDIFISHAHIDHICGFLGLLRGRLGAPAPCNLYGPPGLARHIAGMLSGILWDRIGDRGPRFMVAEVQGSQLWRFQLQAGVPGMSSQPPVAIEDGIICQDEHFQVRAVELDHGTPVLAYAYEPRAPVTVNIAALEARDLTPGPWLGELKRAYLAGDSERHIRLPDGRSEAAGPLARQLLLRRTGEKLVYATDLADNAENRRRLIALARHAHTLVCEAAFAEADRQRAADHGHLTTTACGEIAAAAGVKQLMPFHFSRRYLGQTARLYREIEAAFAPLIRG